MSEYIMLGRSQWIEFQLLSGKFPQGMTLVEYVKRVPRPGVIR
jgi:hypothetical protein